MQPELSINYNSNAGNGQLGVGFSLGGLSIIHRCSKTNKVGKVKLRDCFSKFFICKYPCKSCYKFCYKSYSRATSIPPRERMPTTGVLVFVLLPCVP
jgi:hypothetical protein